MNNFIRVYFDSNSTITCVFISELDAAEKSCRIDYYSVNDKGRTNRIQGNTTNDKPNIVSLSLINLEDGQYRYTILASSNTTTVRVEGDFTKGTHLSLFYKK